MYSVMYAVLFSKYVVMHGVMPHVFFLSMRSWGVASCCGPCW